MKKFSFIKEFTQFVTKKLSIKYHFNRKHTEEKYIEEIINVLRSTTYWRRYNGSIDGRILNNKHNYYIKNNVYKEFYKYMLNKYCEKNKTGKWKYISIDSTFIQNKFGIGKIGRNKFYKNKKGVKISSIFVDNGSINDAKLFHPTFDLLLIKTSATKYKNSNKHKQYFMADKGYHSKKVIKKLEENDYIPIIPPNKRNTKDVTKLKFLNKEQKKKYKKRIIVENYFSWIMMNPKIMCMYEKTIESFNGLVYLASIYLLGKRLSK